MSEVGDSEGSHEVGSVDGSISTPNSPGSLSEGEVGASVRTNIPDEASEVLASLRQYGAEDGDAATEGSEGGKEESNSPSQDGVDGGGQGVLLSSSIDFGTDSEAEERAKHRFFDKLERQGMASSAAPTPASSSAARPGHPPPPPGPAPAVHTAQKGPQQDALPYFGTGKAPTATFEAKKQHVGLQDGAPASAPTTHGELAGSVHKESFAAASLNGHPAAVAPAPSAQVIRPPVQADVVPPAAVLWGGPSQMMRSSFPLAGHPQAALEQLRPQPLQITDSALGGPRESPVKSTPGSRARPSSTESRRQSAVGGSGRLGAVASGNLGSRVEELRAQVAEERAARQAMQQRLSDCKKEAERNEKRVREELEARVREAQRARTALEQRVAELEGGSARERVMRAGGEVVLAGEELRALRQEVVEQEGLLRGYQAENEKLVERLREVQAGHKAEREAAQREHERLAGHLAQVENEGHGQQSRADAATHLQRILQLEAELESVRSAAASREVELKFEIDRARQGRKELEARFAGLDPHKMAHEDQALAAANQALAAEREARGRDVALLESKLRWYTENQAIVTEQDETIKMQAARIVELEALLRAASSGSAAPSTVEAASKARTAAVAPAKAAARIRQLEKQVKELEASLAAQRADPNSLTALIQATRGPDDAATLALRAELEQLRAAHASKDDDASKALRGLRQEHERIKRQYEERLRAAQAQLAERAAKKADRERGGSAGRVKELEKQVEDLRGFYTKKVKELQRKLEEAGRAAAKPAEEGGSGTPVRTPGTANGGRGAGLAKELARAKERITQLEDVLARKEAALAALQAAPNAAQGAGAHKFTGAEAVGALHTEVEALRGQNEQLRAQLHQRGGPENEPAHPADGAHQHAAYQRVESKSGPPGGSAPRAGGWPPRAAGEGWVEEVVALQRRAEVAELSRDLAARQAQEAIERAAVLRLQHQQTVAQLQEAHAARLAALEQQQAGERTAGADLGLRERLEAAEAARGALQEQVAHLTRHLKSGRHGPPAAQLAALEARLRAMEEAAQAREARWQAVVADTQRILAEEADAERQQWAAAFTAKNAEIARFRAELDDILGMAAQLQGQRGPAQ
ncbi:hypothetical protein KFL_002830030 [Klebsormidium nitens]|uniref:Centrosomal protein of 162 kDa n=1 Tax=Klebsormidium nitens TaxID=105231 RepID=A0A1Y1IC64_KLENI|nr:hypothetical protein KFL_002830030 [Klebsormidium nitens]|eukprot:GAQ86327.1 hypothetical protein KFL_002830030 [Klebsormidium nitens]